MTQQDRKPGHAIAQPSGVAARSVGIVCIALGFVIGMEGLSETQPVWLRTGLGLIVTGLVAQVYALICRVRWRRHPQGGSEETREGHSDRHEKG